MIYKLQGINGKTKKKFHHNISEKYEEMSIRRQNNIFQFQEDPFSKNAEGISKIYHELLIILKFLQTKHQVKKINTNFYDLYYTVI